MDGRTAALKARRPTPPSDRAIKTRGGWAAATRDRPLGRCHDHHVDSGRGDAVTFLFTDIEGSTGLWEAHPGQMRSALAHHDVVVHGAIEECGGRLVKSTGDGAFAVFTSPHDAVGAAVAAQTALAAADWPEPIVLRTRMGVHAGQATVRNDDYFGPDVNRAARIMAAGHGGQIVCSAAVAEQIRETFPLLDLGEHRLRDLQAAVHLFQVDAAGRSSVFPPLRSLDAYRSNLPYELSSFVGRSAQLRDLVELLRGSRVVSIVGVGGVGKTRLGLQVGSDLLPDYPDGVWLCELAAVLDPADLPDAVAAAAGYIPPQGVPVAEGLLRFLERRHLLLILDNCEHLVSAVAEFVAATTARAPHLSVLATSREALGIRGEHSFPLPSLGMAERADPESVLASESGGLFVARASEARGTLTLDEQTAGAVRGLCARLDGIPLALEIAAAQTAMMTPAEILTRLDRQFRLAAGGRIALERHQTLRAAIDWSYNLLTEDQQALLSGLSVCVGGFDLDAAAAIGAGMGVDEFDAFETLRALVGKSLVERAERDGRSRYRLLEMIRQYAAEKLAVTEVSPQARDAHARHYLALAISLFQDLTTAADYQALGLLETDTANIGAAGRWLLDDQRHTELLDFFRRLRFVDYIQLPPNTNEELGRLAADAATQPGAAALPGFPDACYAASNRAFLNDDVPEIRRWVALAKTTSAGQTSPGVLHFESVVAILGDGDPARAATLARTAADQSRRRGDDNAAALSLGLCAVCESVSSPLLAVATAEEAVTVARRTGSLTTLLYPLVALTVTARFADPPLALDAAQECQRIDRTPRRTWSGVTAGMAAVIQLRHGNTTAGLEQFRHCLKTFDDNGERLQFSMQLGAMADGIVHLDEPLAIELAAIADSDAIARCTPFTTNVSLAQAAQAHPDAVASARTRAATMTYDDALTFVYDAIERLIASIRADRGGGAGSRF